MCRKNLNIIETRSQNLYNHQLQANWLVTKWHTRVDIFLLLNNYSTLRTLNKIEYRFKDSAATNCACLNIRTNTIVSMYDNRFKGNHRFCSRRLCTTAKLINLAKNILRSVWWMSNLYWIIRLFSLDDYNMDDSLNKKL